MLWQQLEAYWCVSEPNIDKEGDPEARRPCVVFNRYTVQQLAVKRHVLALPRIAEPASAELPLLGVELLQVVAIHRGLAVHDECRWACNQGSALESVPAVTCVSQICHAGYLRTEGDPAAV